SALPFLDDYASAVFALMRRFLDEERPAVTAAAELVADAVADDRLVHVFGTGGHSVMGAEEVFFRAGGLVAVNAILDEGVMLGHGALRSTNVERTPGYARAVLDYHQVGAGAPRNGLNAHGITPVPTD